MLMPADIEGERAIASAKLAEEIGCDVERRRKGEVNVADLVEMRGGGGLLQ